MNHLDLTPNLHKNISFTYYNSGHMVYLDSNAHAKMHKDYTEFIDATSAK
jgi:carboxypeptidase C (cathepsin A)